MLTQYHHVLTSTAFYWPSTTKYQLIQPCTDLVPSCIDQYHQVPTVTAFYWPSKIIYQPVPLNTDPVPPSINQYQPILLLHGDYRLLHSLPRTLFRKIIIVMNIIIIFTIIIIISILSIFSVFKWYFNASDQKDANSHWLRHQKKNALARVMIKSEINKTDQLGSI